MNRRVISLLIVSFVCFLSSVSYGQISAGVIASYNSSNLSGVPPGNTSYNSQANGGIGFVAEFPLAEDVYLSLRPMLQNKGSIIAYDLYGQPDPEDSLDIKLSYLSLISMIKVFSDNKKFYITGGIEMALLTGAELVIQRDDEKKEDISEGIQSYDLLINFGIGYKFNLGKPKLLVELNYTQGLTNISEAYMGSSGLQLPDEFKNLGLQLSAAIIFPIGKGD